MVEPSGFADRLYARGERKESRMTSRFGAWFKWKTEVAIY